MARVRGWLWTFGVILFFAAAAMISYAQTFTTLVNFDGKNGRLPLGMALVQGSDGNFYGTTYFGGASCNSLGNGCGTVFKVTPEGKLTRLYSFCTLADCADGRYPQASLVQASNGMFYGTTTSGPRSNADCGTVFEITTAGALTTLHTFGSTDGCYSSGGLIQAANGDFYGTTQSGGAYGSGTVFKMTPTGTLTTIYNFCSLPNCADGRIPEASLAQAANGSFYGTTVSGGASNDAQLCPIGCGTVFEISPAGKLETLYSFCTLADCADGESPEASLIQATDGNFYGTTFQGGVNCTTAFGCGTVFATTAGDKFYSFCSLANCADGSSPEAPLVQATDGNLYGTTWEGGAFDGGTIFEIPPAGILTTLYSFYVTGGYAPYGGLLQATNGIFYGTAESGGASGDGTVFSLDTGLGPFVSFIRNPAKVGQQFGILGYGLTGTSGVVFNGISARFTAKSDTLLVATVPVGATTGYVTVTTPSGALTSNVPFRVIP